MVELVRTPRSLGGQTSAQAEMVSSSVAKLCRRHWESHKPFRGAAGRTSHLGRQLKGPCQTCLRHDLHATYRAVQCHLCLGCSGFSAELAMLLALVGTCSWIPAADCRRSAGSDCKEVFCQCCREKRSPPAKQKRCLLALEAQQRLRGSSCFRMHTRT